MHILHPQTKCFFMNRLFKQYNVIQNRFDSHKMIRLHLYTFHIVLKVDKKYLFKY